PYDCARVGNVKALAQRLNLSLSIQRTCVLGPLSVKLASGCGASLLLQPVLLVNMTAATALVAACRGFSDSFRSVMQLFLLFEKGHAAAPALDNVANLVRGGPLFRGVAAPAHTAFAIDDPAQINPCRHVIRDYRLCSIMRFTESWLTTTPNTVTALDGFQLIRTDRTVESGLEERRRAGNGTGLAPFLFTIYTADFPYHSPSCHLQKLSDKDN
ncbi:unnamed protein product, partial [Pleuronectes platessa]